MNPASPAKPKITGLQPLRDAVLLLLVVLLAGSIRVTWAPEAEPRGAEAGETPALLWDAGAVEPDPGGPETALPAFKPAGKLPDPKSASPPMTPARLDLRVSCSPLDLS